MRLREDGIMKFLYALFITDTSVKRVKHLGFMYWITVILTLMAVQYITRQLSVQCDAPWFQTQTPSEFNEMKAREHLHIVTGFGPRPTGSFANEVLTPNYLQQEFKKLQSLSQADIHRTVVSYDIQIIKAGSFSIDILMCHQITSMYRNLKNLVLRLHNPKQPLNNSAILINCHYDSVIDVPGANDNFISCAMMLEIARVIVATGTVLEHDLIFLFNSAEETLLQASHGFVTQHHWMKDVKMFINLDAAGTAGKHLLFQTVRGSSWLLYEYRKAAITPFTSVVGKEVFEIGIIPSETDFRIFRDFGHIPGLDMAFINDGYVYHTEFDTEDRVPPKCMQLAGANLLSILKTFSVSKYLKLPEQYSGAELVFYDFFGFFMICYSHWLAVSFNLFVLFACNFIFILKLWNTKNFSYYVFLAVLSHCFCLLFTLLVLGGIAYILNYADKSLSWFSEEYNLFGLFVLPYVWCVFVYHSAISHHIFQWAQQSPFMIAEAHFYAGQLMMSVLLLLATCLGVKSSYFLLFWLIAGCKQIISERINRVESQFVHGLRKMICHILPIAYQMYVSQIAFTFFLPIMGRLGSDILPDAVVALLIAFSLLFVTLVFANDVYITHKDSARRLQYFFLHLGISYIVSVLFLTAGFPYNTSNIVPRRQRIVLMHCNQVLHSLDGGIESSSSSMLMTSLDINGKLLIQKQVPKWKDANKVECLDRPYCGIPHLYPLLHLFTGTYSLPAEFHDQSPRPQLILQRKLAITDDKFNLSFTAAGPNYNQIVIMLSNENLNILSWSFGVVTPIPINMPAGVRGRHYFIYNIYGDEPGEPLDFWIVLGVSDNYHLTESNSQVDIALAAHYTDSRNKDTAELLRYRRELPEWTTTLAWSSWYEGWKFDLIRNVVWTN